MASKCTTCGTLNGGGASYEPDKYGGCVSAGMGANHNRVGCPPSKSKGFFYGGKRRRSIRRRHNKKRKTNRKTKSRR